ncbi:hypothetical protein WL94_23235 [Burkholderia cepacia]|nr:hypothetical protein WL94_23235 [Burkholderia cepacia]
MVTSQRFLGGSLGPILRLMYELDVSVADDRRQDFTTEKDRSNQIEGQFSCKTSACWWRPTVRRLRGIRDGGQQCVEPFFDLFDVLADDASNEDLPTKLGYRDSGLVRLSAIEVVGWLVETKGNTIRFAFAGMTGTWHVRLSRHITPFFPDRPSKEAS